MLGVPGFYVGPSWPILAHLQILPRKTLKFYIPLHNFKFFYIPLTPDYRCICSIPNDIPIHIRLATVQESNNFFHFWDILYTNTLASGISTINSQWYSYPSSYNLNHS